MEVHVFRREKFYTILSISCSSFSIDQMEQLFKHFLTILIANRELGQGSSNEEISHYQRISNKLTRNEKTCHFGRQSASPGALRLYSLEPS